MEETLNKILENALNNDELIKGRDKHTWECGYLKGLVIGLAEKFPEVAETLEKRLQFQEEKKERELVEWELANEPHHGSFRQDWDPNYASALKECEAELSGLEDENQYNQERYDAMVASEIKAEEVDPFPF